MVQSPSERVSRPAVRGPCLADPAGRHAAGAAGDSPAKKTGKAQAGAHRPVDLYHCPGESAPISRAVHLGRLSRYYPACRRCVHSENAQGLSPRRSRLLCQWRQQGEVRSVFDAEGAGGRWLNDLTPQTLRRLGQAAGLWVREQQAGVGDFQEGLWVAVATGGQLVDADLLGAIGEGLRWAGCGVLELGAATPAVLALAVEKLDAAAGVWLSNQRAAAAQVHVWFFDRHGLPLSAGAGLETIEKLFCGSLSRPTRRYGGLRRRQIEEPYLARLAPWYHGLRPLSLPAAGALLRRLLAQTGCRLIEPEVPKHRFAEQVRRARAHLGVRVDGSGESCELFDETGRLVPDEHWLVLLARWRRAQGLHAPVVLGRNVSAELVAAFRRLGLEVQPARETRHAIAQAARADGALMAADGQGRCWLDLAGAHTADALQAVTLLLHLLSQSDRPLSQVIAQVVEAVAGQAR